MLYRNNPSIFPQTSALILKTLPYLQKNLGVVNLLPTNLVNRQLIWNNIYWENVIFTWNMFKMTECIDGGAGPYIRIILHYKHIGYINDISSFRKMYFDSCLC